VTPESHRRPLREAERRLLRAKAAAYATDSRVLWRFAAVGAGITFGLWALTLLASDVSWQVVTGFWIVAGGAITLWVVRDVGSQSRDVARVVVGLQSALRRNEAEVYDVDATAFAEFEEFEDEGACYAFELTAGGLLFLRGQQFYETARFPSLGFSLVHLLDERGQTVDVVVQKRGPRAAPARIIPASVKPGLEIPEHMELREGSLGTLDDLVNATR
jgi:hypothetical protein